MSFDALQLRLHPAESRIRKLPRETPAELMAFDLLELDGKSLIDAAAGERREALERILCARTRFPASTSRPMTSDRNDRARLARAQRRRARRRHRQARST